jgi:hypothetical protein
MSKYIIGLSLLLLSPIPDMTIENCKWKLGKYSDREIYVDKGRCYVRNYKIFVDVDTFMNAAVRVH